MISINKFRNILYKTAKYLGDINAIRRGKIGQRIRRRMAGKVTGRMLRKIK